MELRHKSHFQIVILYLVCLQCVSGQSCLVPVEVSTRSSSLNVSSSGSSTTELYSLQGTLTVEMKGVQACPETLEEFQQSLGEENVELLFTDQDSINLQIQDSTSAEPTPPFLQDAQISLSSGAWQGSTFSLSFVAINSSATLKQGEDTQGSPIQINQDIVGQLSFDDEQQVQLLIPSLSAKFDSLDGTNLTLEATVQGQFLLQNATIDTSNVPALEQFCQVPAEIKASSIDVEGEASIGGAITRNPQDTLPIKFNGLLNVLIEGDCPTSVQPEKRIQLVTEDGGLVITPADIQLQLGALADVILSDVMVFFESGVFTDIDQFGVPAEVNISDGSAAVKGQGFLSTVDIQVSLVGFESGADMVGGFTEANGVSTLNIDDFRAKIVIEEEIPGTAISITATINLKANLKADLDFSQAVSVNLNPAKTIPSAAQQQQQEEDEIVSNIAPSPVAFGQQLLGQTIDTLEDGSCPARFQFTDLPGTCSCAPGWGGLECSQCRSADACVDWLLPGGSEEDIAGTECSQDVNYITTSQMKSYACEIDGDAQSIVAPGSLSFICQTHGFPYRLDASAGFGSRLETVGTDQGDTVQSDQEAVANCQIGFAVQGDPPVPVSCKTTDCTFVQDSPNVECRQTVCECVNGCSQGIQDIVDTVKNTVKLIKRRGNTFEVILEDISVIKLFGDCSVGECRTPGLAEVIGDGSISTGDDYDKEYLVVAAAIPLMILLLISTIALLYIFIHRSYWKQVALDTSSGPVAEAITNENGSKENLQKPSDSAKEQQIICMVPNGNTQKQESPMLLQFTGVQCQVKDKILVNKVDGIALSGEVMGVMGPSGSGKTTLLSILSFQNQDLSGNSAIRGEISLGWESRPGILRKVIGFVPQFDNLLATLTVQETVRYAALVRLPLSLQPREINERMRVIFTDLGLWHVRDSKIGGHGIRGVSGGERKRVAIAMEMVTDPPCLIMDEPTSGLDSFTASKLIDTCRVIASRGRIIMMSLHQPSPEMFMKLDKVLLLAQGYKIFLGPPSSAAGFLNTVGYPCPQDTPVAEHLLYIVQQPENLYTVLDNLKGQQVQDQNSSETRELVNSSRPLDKHGDMDNCAGEKFFRRLGVLFWRTAIEMVRNPTLMVLHWLMGIFMGILVGLVFLNVADDISGAQNRAGVVFFALCLFAFSSLTTVDLLMSERLLVVREVRSRYYGMFPYFLAKLSLDGLLLRAIPVLLFTCILYPLMGLNDDPIRVALWCMLLILFACTIGALAMAITAVVKTPGQANLIMNVFLLQMVLVAGYLVNTDSIPNFMMWLHYASVFSYAFEALIVNEVLNLNLLFTVDTLGSATVSGELFLDTLSLEKDEQDRDVYVMLVFYFGYALLALVLMIGASYWKAFMNYIYSRQTYKKSQ